MFDMTLSYWRGKKHKRFTYFLFRCSFKTWTILSRVTLISIFSFNIRVIPHGTARPFSRSQGSRLKLLQTTNPLIARPLCGSPNCACYWVAPVLGQGIPLPILLMSRIWHSSSRYNFWAENWTHHLPIAERMRYQLRNRRGLHGITTRSNLWESLWLINFNDIHSLEWVNLVRKQSCITNVTSRCINYVKEDLAESLLLLMEQKYPPPLFWNFRFFFLIQTPPIREKLNKNLT